MIGGLFGRGKKEEEKTPEPVERGPLAVAIGQAIEIDDLTLQASLAGRPCALEMPSINPFIVAGIGQTMLDADMQLTRYYDDEDRMIQVMGAPGCSIEEAVDVSFYMPWDSVVPAGRSDWDEWTGPNGMLGLPTYDADGIVYQRFWGDGDGRMALVEFVEEVEADGVTREIHQKSMLYARDLGGINEMLLILTQRDLKGHAAEGGASIEFMIGYGINSADVKRV